MIDPLEIDEKVIALDERLRKKHVPGRLYKSTTENKTFLTEAEFYNISKIKTKQQHLFVLAQRKQTENKR